MGNYIQDKTFEWGETLNPTNMNIMTGNEKALDTQVKKNADAIASANSAIKTLTTNFGKNYTSASLSTLFNDAKANGSVVFSCDSAVSKALTKDNGNGIGRGVNVYSTGSGYVEGMLWVTATSRMYMYRLGGDGSISFQYYTQMTDL